MQVLISVSHLNPCDVSATSSSRKLHLSSIQEPSQSYPECYTCFSPPSQFCINCRSQDYCLNAIHVLSDLWQYPCINIPPPCCISPPFSCRYSHLISIQVAYHLQPALIMCGQPPFWFHLIPIQVEIWISPPSTSRLTSTKAPIVTSHCHPGSVSPPPMSRPLHLTSIPGMNQLFTVHENCISALSGPHTNTCRSQNVRPPSIQYLPRLHLGPQILVTFLIYVLYHLYPGHWIRISPPSMSRPTSNQV